MAKISIFAGFFGAAAGLTLMASPASADAIDGNWCAKDGRTLSIRGPAIVTPGGNETQGNYSRHRFNYVVPAGETGAGAQVGMILLNEDSVNVLEGDKAEIWLRCKPQAIS